MAKLIIWIVVFQAIGFLLGLFTQTNIHPWYESLNKSSLTPPGAVFSIVWTVLYVLLAVIGWTLSGHKNEHHYKSIYYLFAAQMLMNWLWTPLFFQLHWLKFSAIWLVSLTVLNWVIMMKVKNKQKGITLLIIPYVLWLIFASYLNVVIAVMN
ncbi:TspO/MBR family protein [Legionella micdadei]|uniref:Tryptophan rich sensory protein TspO n=1 Tax=Legionella micdadei TaxID=451 RepID=A0A098GHU3_LEGMI|nr:TspO/MBR family protein [Legionella micdadei]ARG97038.1 tryptophan-rich sensory protein [Legionella micdadei]ARH00706.1 tryptophan-rich sensory protein [Legionella micdadei]KTD26755.1 tryptophan-rich sensory protein [Legionella micdadei]CEG61547.1 Tryptophan rich sensory protein TspO [Legionella micdadei]SCY45666.1 TspO and MBR related proteins [Legionella micdadei]